MKDTITIPIYPCYSCSYFEQLVCMNCKKHSDYLDAIYAIKQKHGLDIAATVETIAEDKDTIVYRQNRVERLTKDLEKEFIIQ